MQRASVKGSDLGSDLGSCVAPSTDFGDFGGGVCDLREAPKKSAIWSACA